MRQFLVDRSRQRGARKRGGDMGEIDQAEVLTREVFALREARVGPDHPGTESSAFFLQTRKLVIGLLSGVQSCTTSKPV